MIKLPQAKRAGNKIYTYIYNNNITYIYILNCCTACRFGFCPFISSKQRVFWLAERQSLKGELRPSEAIYHKIHNKILRLLYKKLTRHVLQFW